jgi:cell division protein FtsZ
VIFQVDEIVRSVQEQLSPDANIIFGSTFDATLSSIRVTLIVTGVKVKQALASVVNTPISNAQGQPIATSASPTAQCAPTDPAQADSLLRKISNFFSRHW